MDVYGGDIHVTDGYGIHFTIIKLKNQILFLILQKIIELNFYLLNSMCLIYRYLRQEMY